MSTIEKASKKLLRAEIGACTAELDELNIAAQSLRCQQAVLDMKQYQDATCLSVYLAMPSGEMRTDLIVRDALGCGKKVFVPFLYSIQQRDGNPSQRKVMDMLRLNSIQEFDNLQKDSWGIPSLDANTINDRENVQGGHGLSHGPNGEDRLAHEVIQTGLVLMIVPGVAFDASMARLGHGAGFYDRFFTRLCSRSVKPRLVGICLTEQYVDLNRIVMQDWDWRMDVVVTGDGKCHQ